MPTGTRAVDLAALGLAEDDLATFAIEPVDRAMTARVFVPIVGADGTAQQMFEALAGSTPPSSIRPASRRRYRSCSTSGSTGSAKRSARR